MGDLNVVLFLIRYKGPLIRKIKDITRLNKKFRPTH